MLGAMVVHLQRQPAALLHHDSFDLVAPTLIKRLVRAPGPVHLQVIFSHSGSDLLEPLHDLSQPVPILAPRYKDRIIGRHDDHVFESEQCDELFFGHDIGIAAINKYRRTLCGIAGGIPLRQFPYRLPRTHIRPTECDGHDHRLAGTLHQGVIDRFCRCARKGLRIKGDEIEIATRRIDRGRDSRATLGLKAPIFVEQEAGAKQEISGSLWVHKATHHFDLLNWYLESDPAEVAAFSSLRHYGRNGPFRGERCRTCPHTAQCKFYFDIRKNPELEMLYEEPSRLDGYVRDACVFREDIDIPDTMTATLRYASGVQVAYSVNTYMPIEGFHLAFNGTGGRLEIRQYEDQPWSVPPADEILLMPNFGGVERIWVPYRPGGHFGGDDGLRTMLFKPDIADPLGQRAGARAGAVSVLCGLAALESSRTKRAVSLQDLWGGALPTASP